MPVSETRLTSAKASNGMTLEDLAKETAVSVRENVRVRRAFAYAATDGAEEVIGGRHALERFAKRRPTSGVLSPRA